MVIGITGGSGSGKSTASQIFGEFGFLVIDADVVAREVCTPHTPCLREIRDEFGEGILQDNGELDRKKLGEIVFTNPEKLKILNKITHKYIKNEIEKTILQNEKRDILIDAALLYESELDKLCVAVIGVIAEQNERIERLIARDNIERKRAEDRIYSQKDDNFYEEKCDFLIYNNGDNEELMAESKMIVETLRQEEN